MAAGTVNAVATEEPEGISINDWQFIRDLKRLKELRSFLIQEAIDVSPEGPNASSFGHLSSLRYAQNGRAPTQAEWSNVELYTQALFRLLNEPLKRRFLLGDIPAWMAWLPILLAGIALLALIGAIVMDGAFTSSNTRSAFTLSFYLVWLICLGGIGSVAFIGMNALSVQQDITFDISNRRLMVLRIALGALFGLVLTLPFGFDGFMKFITGIRTGSPTNPGSSQTPGLTTQAVLLLLPFILGFSTSLVITILNRLVDAVQAFFGKAGGSERSQPSPATSATAQQTSRTPTPTSSVI